MSHDNYEQGDDDENNVNFRKSGYAYNEDDEKIMIVTQRAISYSDILMTAMLVHCNIL